jgi:hypothetical protein
MGDYYQTCTHKKPEPRARVKGRKDRKETGVKQLVRALCVDRDGDCRLQKVPRFLCSGESEWAHLGDQKRARTRGMEPEERHTTAGSLMLCTGHHRAYDSGRMQIDELTPDGADGPLAFSSAGKVLYTEPVQPVCLEAPSSLCSEAGGGKGLEAHLNRRTR